MDEVIYEEFKGTGNQTSLDERSLKAGVSSHQHFVDHQRAEKEPLMSEEEIQRVWILRKLLRYDDIAAIEFILDKLKDTKTNDEFLTDAPLIAAEPALARRFPSSSVNRPLSSLASTDSCWCVAPKKSFLQLLQGTF